VAGMAEMTRALVKSPPNDHRVHPRRPEIIVAERGAPQRRASAEDRVVARRRGTDGETHDDRRSAGATSSYAACATALGGL